MSDLVGNPEDRFSHNEAHIIHVSHFVPALCVLGHSANSQLKIVVARAINFYFVFLNP